MGLFQCISRQGVEGFLAPHKWIAYRFCMGTPSSVQCLKGRHRKLKPVTDVYWQRIMNNWTDPFGGAPRISVTVAFDDSTFFPTPLTRIDQSTRTRWWGATSVSETGSVSHRRGYSVSTSSGASMGLEYRGSNPLAPRVLLPTTQNFNEIRMEASVNVDFTTGMLYGSYSRSAYPAAQLFFDGKPIANLPASELGPNALMGPNDIGQINGIQICDPSK